MKTYRELFFRGTTKQLADFVVQIKNYINCDWELEDQSELSRDYLFINYTGIKADKACISISLNEMHMLSGELRIVNIIPLEKTVLSVDEYNAVLMQFYNDIIKPYIEAGTELDVLQPSDDIFNPLSVVTTGALKKLESFCSAVNKSSGASHPCDQERWLDFICQTVDDGRMFDASTLADFLQDVGYWGKSAWREEQSHELASEYEDFCGVILYYKKTRGI